VKTAPPNEKTLKPRRRFITMVSLIAALLVCGVMACFTMNRRPAEPIFQGRTASAWLREIVSGSPPDRALEAFARMGTNAHSVLMDALEGRDTPVEKAFRSFYYAKKLPAQVRRLLPQPSDDPRTLQLAAFSVVLNSPDSPLLPRLPILLKEPDSEVRRRVLPLVYSRIGPEDARQIPFLLSAANDTNAIVRAEVMLCLNRIGRSASNAVPAILKLCADKDMDVRMDAAQALWKITGQTNIAVPVLEGILSQENDAHCLEWVTGFLLEMGKADPSLICILTNSLTGGRIEERMTACACLRHIGPPAAAAAIPALRKAMQDPNPELRQRAKWALTGIVPEQAAANSP
jgi:HEAT repeat protein